LLLKPVGVGGALQLKTDYLPSFSFEQRRLVVNSVSTFRGGDDSHEFLSKCGTLEHPTKSIERRDR
jgi:hypothetical protein